MKTLITLVLLAQLSACMSFSDRSFRSTRDSIAEQLPDITLEKEFALTLGNSFLGFLNIVTLDEANLSDLDRVEVAVYNVDTGGRVIDFGAIDFSDTLRSRGDHLQWETVVKVRSEGEQIWVLVGMDIERDSLEAVSVFSLEKNELVLINVDGDLNQMIEFALQPASSHRSKHEAG